MSNEIEYCCLDIEASGFNPEKEEVLELGMVKFRVVEGQITRTDSYNAVYKPVLKNTNHRVLDLTGITTAEMEHGLLFEDEKEKIRSVLAGAVLVGHGLQLDLAFLNYHGLIVGTATRIDTLEMAQVFWPTHKSYNLENLAMNLEHETNAFHRAMADVEATLAVLKGCAAVFQNLPDDTRKVFHSSYVQASYPWAHILDSLRLDLGRVAVLNTKDPKPDLHKLAALVAEQVQTGVVAYPSLVDAKRLASQLDNQTHRFFSGTRLNFSLLTAFINEPTSMPEYALLGALKAVVFSVVGDQAGETINWAAQGKEVVQLLTKEDEASIGSYTYHTDYPMAVKKLSAAPQLSIIEKARFFDWLELRSGDRVSWGKLVGYCYSIYNPLSKFGDQDLEEDVVTAITAIDLCFANILLLFKKHNRLVQGVLGVEDLDPFVKSRILETLDHLCIQLQRVRFDTTWFLHKVQRLEEVIRSGGGSGYVVWVEFSDSRFEFIYKPLFLDDAAFSVLGHDQAAQVLETFSTARLDRYYESRFEKKLSLKAVAVLQEPAMSMAEYTSLRGLAKILSQIPPKSVVLFEDIAQAKEVFDAILAEGRVQRDILVQGIHGGPTKLASNFVWKSGSRLWLSLSSASKLAVSLLSSRELYVVLRGSSTFSHPYIQALTRLHTGYDNDFEWKADFLLATIIKSLPVSLSTLSVTIYSHERELWPTVFDALSSRLGSIPKKTVLTS